MCLSDDELRWLCRFHNNIRNQFTHFEPMGWSVDVSGIPELGKLIGRIIDDIIDMNWGFRHVQREELREFQRDLNILKSGGCFQ